jgi:hypothetical protein
MVLCIDTPDDFPSRLAQSITGEQESLDLSNPFAFYLPLVDQIIQLYDNSVWGFRNLIRRVEEVPSIVSRANRATIADCLCIEQGTDYGHHLLGLT